MLREAQRELQKSKRKNYYKILGVEKNATESEIKKAFKKQAIKCHPDKVSPDQRATAEERFKDLNEAHEVLSDARTRARYDSGRDLGDCGFGGCGGAGGFGGFAGARFGGADIDGVECAQ